MPHDYRICTKCIMDNLDTSIEFDENGVCNHCRSYEAEIKPRLLPPGEARVRFKELVRQIKGSDKGKQYDSVLGLSGGTDSSYLAYLAKANGLRPLLVHMDNGWDAEFAVNNITKIVKKTGFDYYNYVVDWKEFRDLQLSYLRASVVDIEVVTDHAIMAVLYRLADHHGIKYILSGTNYTSEAFMPRGWNYPYKNDLANLLAIHKKFGKVKLKTFPILGKSKMEYYTQERKIECVDLLNLINYRVKEAKKTLKREFDWGDYTGKHHESIFTKFYQEYILPVKFKVDKRRAQLSNLIYSGQKTREETLREINGNIYPEKELKEDYEYVVNKLGLTRKEFEKIMVLPVVPHSAFPSDYVRVGRTSFRRKAVKTIQKRLSPIKKWLVKSAQGLKV